jgi:hypothetical protein
MWVFVFENGLALKMDANEMVDEIDTCNQYHLNEKNSFFPNLI